MVVEEAKQLSIRGSKVKSAIKNMDSEDQENRSQVKPLSS
jgi:hypothetical protein